MVDAAEQKILDSVQGTVDEIMGKLDSGTSFEDLVREYGTDSGMKDEARLATGYSVHNDSILFDPAFQKAAMALEKIGDVSKPVVGQYGVHILQYLRDVPGGAAELTDDMKEEFRASLLSELRTEALNSALDEWVEAPGAIVFTEAGESWKIPAEETAEEAAPAEETASAEEAAPAEESAPAEEAAPAEETAPAEEAAPAE
jgi:parvulin-like peptidyl-prolyl isomerase